MVSCSRLFVLAFAALLLGGCPPPTEDECNLSEDCATGQRCVRFSPDSPSTCSGICGVDTPCESGFACVVAEGIPACVPLEENRPVGDNCEFDIQCATGVCIADEGVSRCVALCTEQVDCPEGERCHIDGVRKICLPPLDNRLNGAVCENSRECLSGRCVEYEAGQPSQCTVSCAEGCSPDTVCAVLNTGTDACVPSIADGDACIDSSRCTGGVCVDDARSGRLCTRPCDEGCAPDWLCLPDSSGEDICLPRLDDRGRGESCDDVRECESGICLTFTDGNGNAIAKECAVPCAEGCTDVEMCWPRNGDVDVCGPILP